MLHPEKMSNSRLQTLFSCNTLRFSYIAFMMADVSLRTKLAYWTVAKLTNQFNHGTNKNSLIP